MPRFAKSVYGPFLCCHRHVYIGNVYVDNVWCHVYNIDKKNFTWLIQVYDWQQQRGALYIPRPGDHRDQNYQIDYDD